MEVKLQDLPVARHVVTFEEMALEPEMELALGNAASMATQFAWLKLQAVGFASAGLSAVTLLRLLALPPLSCAW